MAKKTTIGGQALIEGIFMRGPDKIATAIRKPDGEIELTTRSYQGLVTRHPLLGLPVVRGFVSLLESLTLGTKALNHSASFYEEEGEKEKGFLPFLTFLLPLAGVLFFFLWLPTFLGGLLKPWISNAFLLNLWEGLIRVLIFLTYLKLISRLEDMKRVFEYHGAEHKSIACYEKGEALTVENARRQEALHPRCGTSFLFTVMIVSVLVLSFFGWPNPWMRLFIRILTLPLVAGLAYEWNRWISRVDDARADLFKAPGLWLQSFATIREPDDSMLEVAIVALQAVIPKDPEADRW